MSDTPRPVADAATPPAGDLAATAFGAVQDLRNNPVKTLWRRRWSTLACMLAGLVAGYVVFALSDPVYEGKARLFISQSGPKVVQQDFPGTISSGSRWLDTQCDIIRSPAIIGKVASDPAITRLKTFSLYPKLSVDPMGYLLLNTRATVGTRSEIVTVSVTGPEKEDVAILADKVIDAYREFNDELKKGSASEVAKMIRAQKDKVAKDLEAKYNERLQFQRENASLSFNRDVRNPVLERVNAISAELTRAELEAVRLEAEYNTVKSAVSDPARVKQLLASPQYRGDSYQMRREIRAMQEAIDSLGNTYGPMAPRLGNTAERVEARKKELEAEEASMVQAILGDVAMRLESIRKVIDQNKQYLQAEQAQVLKVNDKQAQFDRIEADIRRLETYNNQLGDQLKSIDLAETAGTMNVFVVQQAKPAGLQIEPDLLMLLFKGGMVGLVLGIGLALLREFLDTRLRSADEIRNVLGLPILGVVPHIQSARTPSARGTVVHTEPMSDVAEAYRTVRTAIYFGVQPGSVRTLLITSPAPGDGKTTLASNIASAMAQAGNRVILLDCDFRKPTQHRIFELEKRIGLSNVLAGEVSIEQATQAVKVPGLHVVPCGPIPSNPSEILNSQGFADLLAGLAEKYDQVVIDSPPVLPVTDARILAACCDGVILALRAEKTTRPAGLSARDQLQSVGGRILGVVVNDVPRRKGVYGYYYADEGRYAYYHYGRQKPANGAPKSNGDGATAPSGESVAS